MTQIPRHVLQPSRPSSQCSALLLMLLLPCLAFAEAAAFTLPELPYPADALIPVIDAETMRIHHGRHHAAYVDQLNAAVTRFPDLAERSLDDIQRHIRQYDDTVRNNAGGHYNHSLFWQLLAPKGRGGEPSGPLQAALERDFGGVESFQRHFGDAARRVFGSGWAWLIVRADGTLAVTTTANQDNPLMDVLPRNARGTPILALDVWEHAYYLGYQNRRSDYVDAWWSVVNWHEVSRRLRSATGG